MTLSDILDRVCLQAGIGIPSAYASSSDRTAKELVLHAQEAGEEITRRAEWSKMYREEDIAADATSHPVPADFHRLIMGGAITLKTSYLPILPVRGADQWAFVQEIPSLQRFFFIKSGAFLFSPAVSAAGATLRYVSKNWIVDGSDALIADTNEPVFSGSLLALGTLWRYKRSKGLPYEDSHAEFEAELAREIVSDRGISP